jgi:putative alpha-1,2-mannosidase
VPGRPTREKTFTIKVRNNSEKNVYIQSARLNGHIVDKPALLHSDVVNGGELVLEMGPEPNKGWGVADELLRRNR